MTVAKQLQERRASVWEHMKALADEAATENRNFSGEEQATWETQNAELVALDARLKAVVDGEERAKAYADSLGKVDAQQREIRNAGSDLGAEMRSWILKSNPADALDVRSATRLDAAIDEYRALTKGVITAGGNTVPTGFAGRFVQYLTNNTTLLQAGVSVVQTSNGDPIVFPRIVSHPTASLIAEAAVIPNSDPVFGNVTLSAYKLGFLTQVSYELLNDSAIDIEGYLAQRAAVAVGNALDTFLLTGTGVNQPRGLLTDTTVGVTGATGTGGAPTADNLIDLIYSVIPPYRSNGVFVMNDTTVATIRKFKDTTGRYLWQESFQQGQPPTILGYPVFTDPNMPTVGVGNKSVVFGDMSTYQVRLAGGVRFERSVDFAFNTDLITFRTLLRGDGALLDASGAVKHFAGAAS